jgi:hypothetical protein
VKIFGLVANDGANAVLFAVTEGRRFARALVGAD